MNPVSRGWKLILRPLRWLPEPVQLVVTGWLSPAYRLGAACLFVDEAGRWLLVRHSYRDGWGLPGGSLDRMERPDVCARREMLEELGVEVRLGPPIVQVSPEIRRCNFLYRAEIVGGSLGIRTAEIEEIRWSEPADIAELDPWMVRVRPMLMELQPPAAN